jgi:hypothetical protein
MEYLRRNPILVKLIELDGTLREQYLFVNDAPANVIKSVTAAAEGTIDTKTLRQYYGNEYIAKLGLDYIDFKTNSFEITGAGDSDINNINDIDVGDIFNAQQQPAPEPPKTAKTAKLNVVTSVIIFPEDRVSDFKLKLFSATGVVPMFQHLFSQNGPLAYQVWLDYPMNINIVRDYGSNQKVMGYPVDQIMFTNRSDVFVKAFDTTRQIKDIYDQSGSSIIWASMLELHKHRNHLLELYKTDKIHIDLLYWGFIVKFYPMITADVWDVLITDTETKDAKDTFPELFPAIASVQASLAAEREILQYTNELKSAEFTEFQRNITVSVKSANLVVDAGRVELSNRIKLDVRSLWDLFETSATCPIVKLGIMNGRQALSLSKLCIGDETQKVYDAIKYRLKLQTMNSILFVLTTETKHAKPPRPSKNAKTAIAHMRNSNSAMTTKAKSLFYASFSGATTPTTPTTPKTGGGDSDPNDEMDELKELDDQEKKGGDDDRPEKPYMIVTIQSNGRYQVRLSWDDEFMSISSMYDLIHGRLTEFISSINELGRKVFNSSNKLPTPNPYNSRFSDLCINMLWMRSLNDAQHNALLNGLKMDVKAGLMRSAGTAESGDAIMVIYKAMVHGNLDQYPEDASNNQYSYMSNSEFRQAWMQSVEAGCSMTILRRTTDVRFDINDMSEEEFNYFYNYFTARLYKISSGFAKAPVKTVEQTVDEKGRLRLLKKRDPKLYDFKRFGSDLVYSRICQKPHQPIPYYQNEYDMLPASKKKGAVKYWNFTNSTPMWYVCPNPLFPQLSFIVGKHPKNYCLPCCKKTQAYEHELSVADNKDESKKIEIYNRCCQEHEWTKEDVGTSPSRYIMTYGKSLDIGRISYLPGLLEKYLMYNLDAAAMADDGPSKIVELAPEPGGPIVQYSVDALWKISKNNKVRDIPMQELVSMLKHKRWSYDADKPTYSPQDILDNPNLSSKHYSRITNADLSYPLLLFRKSNGESLIIDGLHRLAKAASQNHETIKTRWITARQLQRATTAPKSETDILKNPGFYVYGVPQNTLNVDNVGCLYVVAAAMMMTPEDFVKSISQKLRQQQSFDLFKILLGGKLTKYFTSLSSLADELERIISHEFIPSRMDFTHWNELFIDIARVMYNKWSIIMDDQTVDTSGTSIKVAHDNIHLVLPSLIQEAVELIPVSSPEQPLTREFIIILRRSRKTKNILMNEYYYYPIFVFVPHEFFKSLEIKKRIFTQDDNIIGLFRTLIDRTIREQTATVDEINLHVMEKFITAKPDYKIIKLYCTIKDYCYAVQIQHKTEGLITVPVAYSSYGPTYQTQRSPLLRSELHQKFSTLKQLAEDFNGFVVSASKAAGMTRMVPDIETIGTMEERLVVPIYPFIRVQKFLTFDNDIIGFSMNDMHYWFDSVASMSKLIKQAKTGYDIMPHVIMSSLETETTIQYRLRYDPDIINTHIWQTEHGQTTSKPVKDRRTELLAKAKQHRQMYPAFISAFMEHIDSERHTELRNKIKAAIIRLRQPDKIRNAVSSMLAGQIDIDKGVFESLINEFVESKSIERLLSQIDDTVFRFDRITLTALEIMSDGYLQQDFKHKQAIHAKLVKKIREISRHIDAPVPKDRLENIISVFAGDIINPLKRNYLLSGIYGKDKEIFQFTRSASQQIFIEV